MNWRCKIALNENTQAIDKFILLLANRLRVS